MQTLPNIDRPYVIGLTGGIGSGKTTVSNLFIELFGKLGVELIDADEVSRELVKPGSPALKAIENHFGHRVIKTNGELDRSLLRKIIFSDENEKLWLEDTLHPLIREKIFSFINASLAPYLILSAPLLLESNHYHFVDQVLVVDISPTLQIERTMQRDHISREDVQKIISSQMSREDRLAKADDVIINNQDVKYLKQQVLNLHDDYISHNKPSKT